MASQRWRAAMKYYVGLDVSYGDIRRITLADADGSPASDLHKSSLGRTPPRSKLKPGPKLTRKS